MSSKEEILATIARNKPAKTLLPEMDGLGKGIEDPVERFKAALQSIGGKVIEMDSLDELPDYINKEYTKGGRIISSLPVLASLAEGISRSGDPHELKNVELAVLPVHFGVAENAAVWITEELMGQRALPFISQHLAVVVYKKDIVPTMHDAYNRIGMMEYGFGVFIAGPSKTADIEQSLVLGAHGPKSMTVFLMES